MPSIDIDDTTIHYERAGHGPTLLFIHGMCGDADVWADQSDRLSDRYDCVRYDRRGHTRSTRGTAAISDSRHADDAAALISALGLAPCLVVGSSGGATITVDLLLRHPHLLRGAVLSEPPLFCLDPDGQATAMAGIGPAVARAEATGDPTAFVDGFFPVVAAGLWDRLDAAGRDRYRANAEIGLADLLGPSPEPTADDLAAVHVPCLVLSGDSSPEFFGTISRRLATSLPDARLIELTDCGHATYIDQPEQFEHAVVTFAGEVGRRDATAGSRS